MLDTRPDVSRFLQIWLRSRRSAADAELMTCADDTRSLAIFKAAVNPATLSASTAPAFSSMSSAILESIAGTSVIDALMEAGVTTLPFRGGQGAALIATIVGGGAVAEGAAKPVSVLTLYAERVPARLMVEHRMTTARPNDEHNLVEVRKPFWGESLANRDRADLVPPALVYADLLATDDARCIETAQTIYEKYLARLFTAT